MERTYNVFVDNGLYVLGHYLDKDIDDIKLIDLITSTELMTNKFIDLANCDYYKSNIDMGFHNSAYTQPLKKDGTETRFSKVKGQYDLILNNIGDDEICSICGKKHIKSNANIEYLSALSRCLMPRLHSNTFINFTNNLQLVNICPLCIYLSMISLFNFYKAGANIVLYNSDNNEFMEDYTFELQNQTNRNTLLCIQKSKEKISNIKYIKETIKSLINKNKKYEGYIQAISFYNGGQGETYQENIIYNKDLKFIKTLESKALLTEFSQKWIFDYLIKGQLQTNYLSYVFDENKKELKVSEQLFNEIEEVYSKLTSKKIELIKSICGKIYNTSEKDEIKQLKVVSKLNQFEELILQWSEIYQNKTNKLLCTIEEYDLICNYKEFANIKRRMIVAFSTLSLKIN